MKRKFLGHNFIGIIIGTSYYNEEIFLPQTPYFL